ncbi:hypothetical protein [Deinococcus arenicola]|uniref:Uncharacterized protein n=1 Tax=Deinococcus arenicola TaxID=2994950 RepID=A0ABU4DVM5_9DEIO|nr:hypothetical protein [Deinococcus sp. ZS9-10]MDV6376494.1 hypothetical protein [Deinococcus sp. ZS9-10]
MRDEATIATDASAVGTAAAYGGVIRDLAGHTREVRGQIPRTALQEVTAAIAALQQLALPPDLHAVLHVDAQDEELRAVLCVTHPGVTVVRIPRNSSPLHQRAHELATQALRELPPSTRTPTRDGPSIAAYAVRGVDSPAPAYAVAFWINGEIQVVSGTVEPQETRALTSYLLKAKAQEGVPTGFKVIESGYAVLRNNQASWGVTGRELAQLRSAAAAGLSEF